MKKRKKEEGGKKKEKREKKKIPFNIFPLKLYHICHLSKHRLQLRQSCLDLLHRISALRQIVVLQKCLRLCLAYSISLSQQWRCSGIRKPIIVIVVAFDRKCCWRICWFH